MLLAQTLPVGLDYGWFVPLGLAAVPLLGAPRLRAVLALLAGFAWSAAAIDARLADRLPSALEGADVEVYGWIDDFPVATRGRTSFSFRVASASAPGVSRRLRLVWYDVSRPLIPGETLRLVARLHRPRGFLNPGGFDYERWALTQGYGASGYVREGAPWSASIGGAARAWLRVRARVAARIAHAFPGDDAAALVTALVLGERYRFSHAQWNSLQRTGTSHLFAISGLHIGLVAGFVFVVARFLWLRLPAVAAGYALEVGLLASAAAASGYAALAGFTVPTQRALIMLAIAGAGLAARRRLALGSALATALVFVTVRDPLAPASPSFWLSFVAVALLLAMATYPSPGPRTLLGSLGRLVAMQWGLTLGLLAPVAFFFGQVSLVAPLVNIVAVPLFSLVWVPLALVLAALLALFELEPSLPLASIEALARWTWHALAWAGAEPWAAWSLPRPALWAGLLAAAGACLLVLRCPPLQGRRLGWLMLAALLQGYRGRPAAGELQATVLDVGHGLAIVVETAHHALVYDAGPRYRSGGDAGRSVVLPALNALGIARLDRLIVSHADSDHSGGMRSVLDAHHETRLLAGRDVAGGDRGGQCERGQQWRWDGVAFTMLYPGTGDVERGNNGSCLLRIDTAGGALLLTGDLEAAGESAVLASRVPLAASVVVVPHHGSTTSSSAAFVAAVRPRAAVVSAAFASRWGFPKPEVSARWRNAGARVLVTGDAGAITVELGGARPLSISRAREARRYWRAAPRGVPGESGEGEL